LKTNEVLQLQDEKEELEVKLEEQRKGQVNDEKPEEIKIQSQQESQDNFKAELELKVNESEEKTKHI